MGMIRQIKLVFSLLPLIIYSQEYNYDVSSSYIIDTLLHKVERKQNLYLIKTNHRYNE